MSANRLWEKVLSAVGRSSCWPDKWGTLIVSFALHATGGWRPLTLQAALIIMWEAFRVATLRMAASKPTHVGFHGSPRGRIKQHGRRCSCMRPPMGRAWRASQQFSIIIVDIVQACDQVEVAYVVLHCVYTVFPEEVSVDFPDLASQRTLVTDGFSLVPMVTWTAVSAKCICMAHKATMMGPQGFIMARNVSPP